MAPPAWPSVISMRSPPPPLPAWWAPCPGGLNSTGRPPWPASTTLPFLAIPPPRRALCSVLCMGEPTAEGTLSRPCWSAAAHRTDPASMRVGAYTRLRAAPDDSAGEGLRTKSPGLCWGLDTQGVLGAGGGPGDRGGGKAPADPLRLSLSQGASPAGRGPSIPMDFTSSASRPGAAPDPELVRTGESTRPASEGRRTDRRSGRRFGHGVATPGASDSCRCAGQWPGHDLVLVGEGWARQSPACASGCDSVVRKKKTEARPDLAGWLLMMHLMLDTTHHTALSSAIATDNRSHDRPRSRAGDPAAFCQWLPQASTGPGWWRRRSMPPGIHADHPLWSSRLSFSFSLKLKAALTVWVQWHPA